MSPPPASKRWSFWGWLRSLFGGSGESSTPARAAVTERLQAQEQRVLSEFCRQYAVDFHDLDLLKLALTHRSYLSVTGQHPRESNERLEFLGDSVLGLVTSEYLYRRHPEEHEGQLTKTKSLLVSKAIRSRRALKMGLGRYVLLSHSEVESGGRQRLSILADAFESVLGAIYLDQGFDTARAFIHKHLLAESDDIVADKRHTNYKSHLQEFVQSTYRTHPVYRIRSEYGPDHSKHFMVEVMVGRRTLGEGRGHNKKEAEQAAARDALDRVQEHRRGRGDEEREVEREPETERPGRRERREGRVRDESDEDVVRESSRERRSRGRVRETERAPELREVRDEAPHEESPEREDVRVEDADEPRRLRGRRGRGRRAGLATSDDATPRDALPRRGLEDVDPDEPETLDDMGTAAEFEADEALPVDSRFVEDDRSESGAIDDVTGSSRAPAQADAARTPGPGWGRSRRKSGAPAGPATVSGPPEPVTTTEATVDPFEIEEPIAGEAADQERPGDESASGDPPAEEVDASEDDDSRQTRIDELEQALASFGRRSQKFGRRGRRR